MLPCRLSDLDARGIKSSWPSEACDQLLFLIVSYYYFFISLRHQTSDWHFPGTARCLAVGKLRQTEMGTRGKISVALWESFTSISFCFLVSLFILHFANTACSSSRTSSVWCPAFALLQWLQSNPVLFGWNPRWGFNPSSAAPCHKLYSWTLGTFIPLLLQQTLWVSSGLCFLQRGKLLDCLRDLSRRCEWVPPLRFPTGVLLPSTFPQRLSITATKSLIRKAAPFN